MIYKYVVYRAPGNPSRAAPGYYMQHSGVWKGPFDSEKQAAKVAAKHIGTRLADLMKQGQSLRLCSYTANIVS